MWAKTSLKPAVLFDGRAAGAKATGDLWNFGLPPREGTGYLVRHVPAYSTGDRPHVQCALPTGSLSKIAKRVSDLCWLNTSFA